MSFFGCLFNEYIILYFCGLELKTKNIVANRAIDSESESLNELKDNIRKSSSIIGFGEYDSEINVLKH